MVRSATVESGCGAESYPVSPMQRGMLFHRTKDEDPGIDIEQVVCEMKHDVRPAAFRRAWETAFRRHDALRTGFAWEPADEPRQRVGGAESVALPLHEFELERGQSGEGEIGAYLDADRSRGFNTLDAPLARVALFRGGDGRAWFVFTCHHLVLDARGMGLLFKEVLDLHDAFAEGREMELPPVRPYRAYIEWLQTLESRRAESYWREQLRGFRTPTMLPLAAPDLGDGAARDWDELAIRLSADETERIRDSAQRREVTLNTVLQGAWAVVLSRHTGETDVMFGAVRACRHVPVEGAATMVGMLINTVPFRVKLTSAASVGRWLRGLREQWVGLRDYEHTSLMQVQEWSELPPGRPAFDTLFNFQEPSWIGDLGRLGGAWARRRFDIFSRPGYPIALDIYGDESLLIRCFYDRRRLAPHAVAGMLRCFRSALLSVSDLRSDTVGDVTALDPFDRDRVLVEFNRTMPGPVCDTTMDALVRAAALANPDRPAVADDRFTLTYAELTRRANRLARRLRSLGVGPEVPVAVCMPRSVEMVVAWLAVLGAGGAYVPLDPEYPAERLAFQVRDCGAPVLVTGPGESPVRDLAPETQRLQIEPGGGGWGEFSDAPLVASATSRSLAYIIYTSGSTGAPKGVEIEHRSLVNLVEWHRRAYALSREDRATQLASPAFDAAVWEVWPYLASGASVHLPDDETRLVPRRIWQWIADRRITIAFLPTPLAEAAFEERWPQDLSLRRMLTGGDKLRRPPPQDFPCPVINHYGPTESAVVATAGEVRPRVEGAPSIGRPISNIRAYVLDRELRPVSIGAPGELFLSGVSLARGYRGRPELTAEKFVPCPLFPEMPSERRIGRTSMGAAPATAATERMYRTGDLVRWAPDGRLEFIGRADDQVKVRGCRVELGDVEAALQRHPNVSRAAALARSDEKGRVQLVGYVVAERDHAPEPGELIRFLRDSIPSHMVPSAVVVLEKWPLTPNGKIDREALASCAKVAVESRPDGAPETAEERQVAEVWMQVLGRGPIARHANFFELGGHSLLAAQAVARLNGALGRCATVRMLFDHPTLDDFASELGRSLARARPTVSGPRPKRRQPGPVLELAQRG